VPFTPAHVAAVLPVVGRRRSWVVPAAWVVGSMSPDLVYFTPAGWVRPLSHSLEGLLTLDPALGVGLLAAWWLLLAPAVHDLLPRAVRSRVPLPPPPAPGRWPWALVGLFAGSLTHVAWDAFTHHDGWVVRRVPSLDAPLVGGHAAYSVLQDASGVVGLVLLAVWTARWWRQAEPVSHRSAVLSRRERAAALLAVLVFPVVLCAVLTAVEVPSHEYFVNALFLGFTRGVGISVAAAVLAAAGWQVLRRRRAAPVPVRV